MHITQIFIGLAILLPTSVYGDDNERRSKTISSPTPAIPYNPNGPDFEPYLYPETKISHQIDADLVGPNGKCTFGFLLQFDIALKDFVNAPKAEKADQELYGLLIRCLRNNKNKEEEALSISQRAVYLSEKGTINLQDLRESILKQLAATGQSIDALLLNLGSNYPTIAETEGNKVIFDEFRAHIQAHHPASQILDDEKSYREASHAIMLENTPHP